MGEEKWRGTKDVIEQKRGGNGRIEKTRGMKKKWWKRRKSGGGMKSEGVEGKSKSCEESKSREP